MRNHARSVLASDFFVVVTATFRVILRVCRPGSRDTTNPALERDGASDRGLDRAAVSDDCAGRSGPPIRDPRSRHDLLGRCRSHPRGDGSGGSQDAGSRSTSEYLLRAPEGLRLFQTNPRVSSAAQSGQSARRVCREEESAFPSSKSPRCCSRSSGGVPVGDVCRQVGHLGADLLPLEETCTVGCRRVKPLRAEAAPRRKYQVEAPGRRPVARQGHAAGRRPKKVLKPVKQREVMQYLDGSLRGQYASRVPRGRGDAIVGVLPEPKRPAHGPAPAHAGVSADTGAIRLSPACGC